MESAKIWKMRKRQLTLFQKKFIAGTLLGDGFMLRTTRGYCLRIHQGVKQKDYVEWNSLDSNGNLVPSGVYIYELNTDVRNYSRKMILTKKTSSVYISKRGILFRWTKRLNKPTMLSSTIRKYMSFYRATKQAI